MCPKLGTKWTASEWDEWGIGCWVPAVRDSKCLCSTGLPSLIAALTNFGGLLVVLVLFKERKTHHRYPVKMARWQAPEDMVRPTFRNIRNVWVWRAKIWGLLKATTAPSPNLINIDPAMSRGWEDCFPLDIGGYIPSYPNDLPRNFPWFSHGFSHDFLSHELTTGMIQRIACVIVATSTRKNLLEGGTLGQPGCHVLQDVQCIPI